MNDTWFISCLATGAAATLASAYLIQRARSRKLDHIPTVGPSGLFKSALFLTNGPEIIQEGYEKYDLVGPFKVANFTRWIVVLNRHHLMDIMRASEDTVSFSRALRDDLGFEYPLGQELHEPNHHVAVVRSHLTRSISAIYPTLKDELDIAFHENLGLRDNEWKSVPMVDAIQNVVCRTANRVFVGQPLCRNSDWLRFNIDLVRAVATETLVLRFIPTLILPWLAKLVVKADRRLNIGVAHLGPLVEERRTHMQADDKEWVRPNDFLQWLLESAPDESKELVTQRMLGISFAAIQTTSNTFCQALQILAANPQYIQPLREEVELIIRQEGWTKGALTKMRRIDSFLKESQRFQGNSFVGIWRKALTDMTLSDGTFIPKGTCMAFATSAIHHNEVVYKDPNVFDPFRFVHLRDEVGESSKHRMIFTGPEMMAFGLGKPACPGRFFASTVLKTLLAHVVLSYDVKLEDTAPPPKCKLRGTGIAVDPATRIMFRHRT